MTIRNSTLIGPRGRWWSPMGPDERLWVTVTVVWALSMFVMMQLIWPRIGDVQTTIRSYRVDPAEYARLTEAFIAAHQVGDAGGNPVVEPEPGGDVYIQAARFQFRPNVRLRAGETYTFHLSSVDVQHGFSLQPDNVNFQVLPGYVTQIDLTPREAGTYTLLCNEYCGTGHHLMLGGIEVVE